MRRVVFGVAGVLLVACGSGEGSRRTPYDQPPLPRCAASYRAECEACVIADASASEWCGPVLEDHLDWTQHCAWIGAPEQPIPDAGLAADAGTTDSASNNAERLCALTELATPSVAACYAQAPACPQIDVTPTVASADDVAAVLRNEECATALRNCARNRAPPNPCTGLSGGIGTICRLTSCSIGWGARAGWPSSAVALVTMVLARRRRRR